MEKEREEKIREIFSDAMDDAQSIIDIVKILESRDISIDYAVSLLEKTASIIPVITKV